MSIPLDNLYHYIEGIAKDVRRDNVLIYRFHPHGSKNLDDLRPLYQNQHALPWAVQNLSPQIYCYDQEPLDYERYNVGPYLKNPYTNLVSKHHKDLLSLNLRIYYGNIYDKYILLHSELRSANVEKYRRDNCLPVYYWCHAVIALDWFRFAQYEQFKYQPVKQFLIYNRAWSYSREYRLKFADLLIKYDLLDNCQTNINPVEPELNVHYTDYEYIDDEWRPEHRLEDYISTKLVPSSASADYDRDDYAAVDFEVVLETLFDDARLHLTEKPLRPIACGKPFLLAASHGSLAYLRSYGFRTFGSVIDESYDTIEDPRERLEAIVKSMREIANWTEEERREKMLIANQIAAYNRKHFFSSKFIGQVEEELKQNLATAMTELEQTNTSRVWTERKNLVDSTPEIAAYLESIKRPSLEDLDFVRARAREYYMRSLARD